MMKLQHHQWIIIEPWAHFRIFRIRTWYSKHSLYSPDWSGKRWYCFIVNQCVCIIFCVLAGWKVVAFLFIKFWKVSKVGWLVWKKKNTQDHYHEVFVFDRRNNSTLIEYDIHHCTEIYKYNALEEILETNQIFKPTHLNGSYNMLLEFLK